MTDLALFTGNSGSTRVFRRFQGLRRVFAGHWRRHLSRPLTAEAARDSGARRAAQDYASSRSLETASPARLHRIAESSRWNLTQF